MIERNRRAPPPQRTGGLGGRELASASPEAVADAKLKAKSIWIDYEPQMDIIARLREYLAETRGRYRKSLDGRRLSQFTQTGKSATGWRLKTILAEARAAEGLPANPYQVIIVTIKEGMTIKGFLLNVLHEMSSEMSEKDRQDIVDPRGTVETLEFRIGEWAPKLGVELLIIEEVQRLQGALLSKTGRLADRTNLTQQFQTMLDRGIVPMLLIGNEKSEGFFKCNKDFCGRLSIPLELPPADLNDKESVERFQKFCRDFDNALIRLGVFSVPSGLGDPSISIPLHKVSSGHVGRVARLIHEATAHAFRRGAAFIEPCDLSRATRKYAFTAGWTDDDPFSK